VIGAFSDLHLGGGGLADDAFEPGVYWVVETLLGHSDLTALVVAGDMAEGLQFGAPAILAAHAGVLRWLDGEAYQRNLPVWIVEGNHDPRGWFGRLRSVMAQCDLRDGGRSVTLEGWHCVHGNEWDVWNRFGSPLRPLANAVTWLTGVAERAFPGFDENGVDPTRLVSPARAARDSLHDAIRDGADECAAALGCRVLYGHTHRPRISDSGSVVNAGCVIDGRAECAALWPDGRAELFTKPG
jgi:UDP-2,3-diacylglucosamine pyrophosphatase LpxH